MSGKIINDQIGSRGSTFVRPLNIAYNAGGPGGILPATSGTEAADTQQACAQKFDIGQSCLPSFRDVAWPLRCAAEEWPVFAWDDAAMF
jgi:hypothetical protein